MCVNENPVIAQMLHRRSIRRYLPKPVSDEMRETIIRCGQAAPSSSFVQAYSIIRVTRPELRQSIAQLAGGQTWIESAPEFWVLCADLKRVEYCGKKNKAMPLAGHIEHFLVASVDVALMAENMFLAAESLGLGGVLIGGIRNDTAQVAELLGLPDLVAPLFGFCFGYPDQEPDIKPRLPVSAILHTDRYELKRIAKEVDQYDEAMRIYYWQRDSQQRNTTWSEQCVKAVHSKTRAHLLTFLQQRGLAKQ